MINLFSAMNPEEFNDFIAPFQRNAQLQQGLRVTKQLEEIAKRKAEGEATGKLKKARPQQFHGSSKSSKEDIIAASVIFFLIVLGLVFFFHQLATM